MNNSELIKNVKRYYIQILSLVILYGVLLFASAGTFDWFWAWVYLLIFPVYSLIQAFILPKELIAERGKRKENVKEWDKKLTKIGMLPAFAVIIVSGLDFRFNWSPAFHNNYHMMGLALYLLGNVIVTWSMWANRFFSTHVRIQSDRQHEVTTHGPYKIVRHPGYVGIIMNTIFTPIIFGSLWALIPAVILCLLFCLRTAKEDKALHNELQGYKDYAEKVRFRLIPGLW